MRHKEREEESGPSNAIKILQLGRFNETLIAKDKQCRLDDFLGWW